MLIRFPHNVYLSFEVIIICCVFHYVIQRMSCDRFYYMIMIMFCSSQNIGYG